MRMTGDVPKLLVAAVIGNAERLVLLTRHGPYWKWHLPDGEVHFGEKWEEALQRSFFHDFRRKLSLRDASPWLVTETVSAAKRLHLVTHHFRAEPVGAVDGMADRDDLHLLWVQPAAFMQAPSEHVLASTLQALRLLADDEDD